MDPLNFHDPYAPVYIYASVVIHSDTQSFNFGATMMLLALPCRLWCRRDAPGAMSQTPS
jgi:hypothetical protein